MCQRPFCRMDNRAGSAYCKAMNDTRHFTSGPEKPDLAALLEGEDLCALCASQGLCCCRTDLKYAHLSFPLSLAEWARMAPHAHLASACCSEKGEACGEDGEEKLPSCEGLTAPLLPKDKPPEEGDAICVPEINSPDFLRAMHTLFPREKETLRTLFPETSRHLRMRLRADGSCVFQGRAGCRLPRTLRPWYCLLFPVWIQGNAVTLFMSETCLISRRAQSPVHGLKLLHTTREETRRQYACLRKDWGFSV